MIDKIAVPFWLCWTAGLLIGLATGDEIPWIVIGAAVGIVLGLLLAARAARHRREAFHGRAVAAAQRQSTPAAAPSPDIRRAA